MDEIGEKKYGLFSTHALRTTQKDKWNIRACTINEWRKRSHVTNVKEHVKYESTNNVPTLQKSLDMWCDHFKTTVRSLT